MVGSLVTLVCFAGSVCSRLYPGEGRASQYGPTLRGQGCKHLEGEWYGLFIMSLSDIWV